MNYMERFSERAADRAQRLERRRVPRARAAVLRQALGERTPTTTTTRTRTTRNRRRPTLCPHGWGSNDTWHACTKREGHADQAFGHKRSGRVDLFVVLARAVQITRKLVVLRGELLIRSE